jgi:hypothetical protein
MMIFGYERNRTVSPCKQQLKTLDWIVHEIKVIKINIQNRTHIILLCAERTAHLPQTLSEKLSKKR